MKLHRTYTAEELAALLGINRYTVRGWWREGLACIDDRRPRLMHGATVRSFLAARRGKHRQSCAPGEFYCVGCRAPRRPAGSMADFLPIAGDHGNLRALCPVCERFMHRRANRLKLAEAMPDVEVCFLRGQARIGECPSPSVNLTFGNGAKA